MSSSGPALGIASGTTGASGSGSGSGSASGSGSGSSGGGVCPIIGTASCGSHSPPPSLNLQVLNDANRPKLLPNKVYFLYVGSPVLFGLFFAFFLLFDFFVLFRDFFLEELGSHTPEENQGQESLL